MWWRSSALVGDDDACVIWTPIELANSLLSRIARAVRRLLGFMVLAGMVEYTDKSPLPCWQRLSSSGHYAHVAVGCTGFIICPSSSTTVQQPVAVSATKACLQASAFYHTIWYVPVCMHFWSAHVLGLGTLQPSSCYCTCALIGMS